MSNASFATPARRGRPPSGRKVVLQVPVDADEADAIRVYAEETGRTMADVLRDLVRGRLKWKEVAR